MENLLLKKLKIKSNFVVSVINAPKNLNEILGDIPSDLKLSSSVIDQADAYLVFAITKTELKAALNLILSSITDKTIVWIIYPKAKTILAADLDLMHSWQDLIPIGLGPAASAAVNNLWTALRIKTLSSQKKTGIANAELASSHYGEYINVANKTVTIPPYLMDALVKHPSAINYFDQLAYSHRKEYILWIITAKQEKTRLSRIDKMIEMLLAKKKNPSEKL